jgi:N4-gp56 family major capsid protein
MAVTVRGTGWGGAPSNTSDLLINAITEEIRALEPELVFARLGTQKDVMKGYDRLLFYQTNQIAVVPSTMQGGSGGSVWGGGTSVLGSTLSANTTGITAITEGTNPSSITWGAQSFSASPYQYGVLIQVSDLLVHGSAIDVVQNCVRNVKYGLARIVDSAIQVVVNGGTNGVIYAGGRSSRSSLAAGDLLTTTEVVRGVRNLRAVNGAGLRPYDGKYYAMVTHPNVEADLMLSTNSGGWSDAARYTSIDDMKSGRFGEFRGVRTMTSGWVNYFNSTVSVFPTTLLGEDSFGWGYIQPPTPELVASPDSNNALNLYTSIGGKVALAATRFEDQPSVYRIVRMESASQS